MGGRGERFKNHRRALSHGPTHGSSTNPPPLWLERQSWQAICPLQSGGSIGGSAGLERPQAVEHPASAGGQQRFEGGVLPARLPLVFHLLQLAVAPLLQDLQGPQHFGGLRPLLAAQSTAQRAQ